MSEETEGFAGTPHRISSTEFDSLTEEEIQQLTETVKQDVSCLKRENRLLAHFVSQVEERYGSMEIGMEKTVRRLSLSTASKSFSKPLLASSLECKSSKSETKVPAYPTLSISYKCFIAKKSLEDLKLEFNSLKRSRDVATDVMKARDEEIKTEKRELLDEMQYFNEKIKTGAKHHVTRKIMAEKVEKYFDDSLKKTSIAVERIKMQISENRMKKKKLIEKMNEKIEAGKLLQEVDIEKTKLENEESRVLLTQYQNEYYDYRARINRLLQDIDEKKKTLSKEKSELDALLEQVSLKERSQEVFELEKGIIEKERDECKALKEKILSNPRCRDMPEVMEYVRLQAALEERAKQVKSWRGKVEAMQMAKFCSEGK